MERDNVQEEKNREERKSRFSNKKLLLVFLIFIITFLGFGISISVINSITIPGKDNVVNTIIAIDKDGGKEHEGKLVFSYYEKPGVGNGIKLYNQFPTSDEVGKAFKGDNYVFEFKLILNEKAAGIRYNIVAEKMPESDLRDELMKIYLESDGKAVPSVIRTDNSIKTFNEFSSYKKDHMKVIYSSVVTREEARRGYKNFVFKMWLSEGVQLNQDDFLKTFVTRINVYASGDL